MPKTKKDAPACPRPNSCSYPKCNCNKPKKADDHWRGMPEFVQKDLKPIQRIAVNFSSTEDVVKFAKLIGQKLTAQTRSIWFPDAGIDRLMDKRYISIKKDKL